MADTAKVVDYDAAEPKFIPLREAPVRMDQLKKDRAVVGLFGLDFSEPLSNAIKKYLKLISFTHSANTLIYLNPEKVFQFIINAIESTKSEGGVIKLHNDPNLGYDPLFYSLTLKKDNEKLKVLSQITHTSLK